MPKYFTEKIKQESETIRLEMRERMLGFIVGAFGLVAGLAWNDAIKALIEYLFPLSKNTLLAKFGYALLISIIVVIATVYITKLLKRGDKPQS